MSVCATQPKSTLTFAFVINVYFDVPTTGFYFAIQSSTGSEQGALDESHERCKLHVFS